VKRRKMRRPRPPRGYRAIGKKRVLSQYLFYILLLCLFSVLFLCIFIVSLLFYLCLCAGFIIVLLSLHVNKYLLK
jgi:hypothetical protein